MSCIPSSDPSWCWVDLGLCPWQSLYRATYQVSFQWARSRCRTSPGRKPPRLCKQSSLRHGNKLYPANDIEEQYMNGKKCSWQTCWARNTSPKPVNNLNIQEGWPEDKSQFSFLLRQTSVPSWAMKFPNELGRMSASICTRTIVKTTWS